MIRELGVTIPVVERPNDSAQIVRRVLCQIISHQIVPLTTSGVSPRVKRCPTFTPVRITWKLRRGRGDAEVYAGEDHVGSFAEGEAMPEVYAGEDHVGGFADGRAQS